MATLFVKVSYDVLYNLLCKYILVWKITKWLNTTPVSQIEEMLLEENY